MSSFRSGLSSTRQRVAAHKFLVLIVASVVVSLILVWIALSIYTHSDAARLDLSHPDYKPLRSKITVDKSQGYLSTGLINDETLDEFEKKFTTQAQRATEIDAFGGQVLTDESLGIE